MANVSMLYMLLPVRCLIALHYQLNCWNVKYYGQVTLFYLTVAQNIKSVVL